ncbi:hypothetical protein [Streptomyces sp. NPDC001401]|uniref:hypothetical protein n=1 Tax=Streptomyces sp. NPDC001401 TaxID=3364570 RepID=UPI0036AEDD92
MHRTTTTATLLVTVAVSALSGCVTVQRPPASGPPPAPSRPSVPHADDEADPQIVQAPAREALQRVGPSRRPEPKSSERHGPSAQAPATAPAEQPAAHPESGHHGQPRAKVPDVPKPVPKNTKNTKTAKTAKNTDMCALGRKYGRWRADSPEAVICKQTYGS